MRIDLREQLDNDLKLERDGLKVLLRKMEIESRALDVKSSNEKAKRSQSLKRFSGRTSPTCMRRRYSEYSKSFKVHSRWGEGEKFTLNVSKALL